MTVWKPSPRERRFEKRIIDSVGFSSNYSTQREQVDLLRKLCSEANAITGELILCDKRICHGLDSPLRKKIERRLRKSVSSGILEWILTPLIKPFIEAFIKAAIQILIDAIIEEAFPDHFIEEQKDAKLD